MKFFLLLGYFVTMAACQNRAGYAGVLPKGPQYQDVHNNFRNGTDLGSRGGFSDPSATVKSVDDKAKEIYQTWPRENQPFSVLNAAHIDQHLQRPLSTTSSPVPTREPVGNTLNGNQNSVVPEQQSRGAFGNDGNFPETQLRENFGNNRHFERNYRPYHNHHYHHNYDNANQVKNFRSQAY